MIADALDGQPRSLAQYADELRAICDADQASMQHWLDQREEWLRRGQITEWRYYAERAAQTYASRVDRLLAVEREINWRMGI